MVTFSKIEYMHLIETRWFIVEYNLAIPTIMCFEQLPFFIILLPVNYESNKHATLLSLLKSGWRGQVACIGLEC
jgi:hypothetical protein